MIRSTYEEGNKGIKSISLILAICLHLFVVYILLTMRTSVITEIAPVSGDMKVYFTPLKLHEFSQASITSLPMLMPHLISAKKKQVAIKNRTAPRTISSMPTDKIVVPTHEKIPTSIAPPTAIPSADDMILNAKRDIGKINRELRNAFPKLPPATVDTAQSRLEKGIAAAAKSQALGMEELTLSDGRKMTKVVGSGGTYCISTDSVGASDGIDYMQSGVKKKMTNCPR